MRPIRKRLLQNQKGVFAGTVSGSCRCYCLCKGRGKTEREFYVEGINCNVAIARDQFITVKEQYQKTDGIQAYHGYLSFKETDISPEMAQKIGMEFANEVWGERFQVVVTTHLNTKHLHCHFVINSISFVDGKHLWGEEKRGSNSEKLQTEFVRSTDFTMTRIRTAVSSRII